MPAPYRLWSLSWLFGPIQPGYRAVLESFFGLVHLTSRTLERPKQGGCVDYGAIFT